MKRNGKNEKETITSGDLADAARKGNLDFLKKALIILENSLLPDKEYEDWLIVIFNKYINFGFINNHEHIITYFIENGILLDNLAKKAARNNKHQIIDLLHKNHFKFNENIGVIAAKFGCIDVLMSLHKIDFKFNEETFIYASENGRLDCVTFLYEIGVPINVGKCNNIEHDSIYEWGLKK